MSLFTISGDIAQVSDGTEVTYFHSTRDTQMVVNVFNTSNTGTITARLKDKHGKILVSDTVNPRVTISGGVVVNQQKTLVAKRVRTVTIIFTDPTSTNEGSGRYEGQIKFMKRK